MAGIIFGSLNIHRGVTEPLLDAKLQELVELLVIKTASFHRESNSTSSITISRVNASNQVYRDKNLRPNRVKTQMLPLMGQVTVDPDNN